MSQQLIEPEFKLLNYYFASFILSLFFSASCQSHQQLWCFHLFTGQQLCTCASHLCSDETQFRNCIVWLEDQKIRHYKIEDRGNLRNIPSSDWPKAYEKVLKKSGLVSMLWSAADFICENGMTSYVWASFALVQYLQDLNSPFGVEEKQEAVDWLLGLAVRYEYGDNGTKL